MTFIQSELNTAHEYSLGNNIKCLIFRHLNNEQIDKKSANLVQTGHR